MQLSSDYFALFALPKQFDVDNQALSSRYRELQQETHPDKFAHASEQEQRVALQYSAYINEAYTTLRSTLKRGIYLLSLQGYDVANMKVPHDPMFLMEQMTLREGLEELAGSADVEAAVDNLNAKIAPLRKEQEQAFVNAYEQEAWEKAAVAVTGLQFLFKLQSELDEKESELLD